jgi:hypothetical protein
MSWKPYPKISQAPKLRSQVLKTMSWPQSWDPKSWKPCPENHILKFPRSFCLAWPALPLPPGPGRPCCPAPALQPTYLPRWWSRRRRRVGEENRPLHFNSPAELVLP